MAKHCEVCKQSYSDDLEACPHCAQADEDAVDLGEIFEDDVVNDDLPSPPPDQTSKKAAKTMLAVSVDDEAIDLAHGKSGNEEGPAARPKTMMVNPEQMEAVARGEEEPAPSIFDSRSAVDLNSGASSVNLGSSDHLASADVLQGGRISSMGEEAPTVDHVPEEDTPAVGQAADEEAAEEELPVVEHAAEDDEDGTPRKKAKVGSRMWVAGAAGMVVGSAATVVLAVLNLLPFVSAGGDKPAPRPASAPVVAQAAVAPAAPAVAPEQYLAYGDFAKAVEGFGAQETQDPAVLVKRGQARWLQYLQEKKQANAPLKKDDETVAQAVKDLTEAKNAEGTLWLGVIEESISGPAPARKIYQEGAAKFKEPADQRLFQSALDRLDAAAETPAARQTGRLPRLADTALALAGLTIALQDQPAPAAQQQPAPGAAAPTAPQPNEAPASPPAKPIEEAGADFWKALKLAKEHKYDEALASLRQARATHDQQRFARLYKAQNPTTDPTEAIFLRACDELAAYWQMRRELAQGGYLAQGKPADPVAALKGALAAAKESQGPNKALASLAEQLKKDKDVAAADPEVKDVAKAIETLAAAKQKSQDQLAAVQAALGDNANDPAAAVKQLLEEKKTVGATLAGALQALKAGKYDPQADLGQTIAKLIADKQAASENATATAKKLGDAEAKLKGVSKQLDDVKYAQATQSRTQGPREMLAIWLPLLAQDRVAVNRTLCDTAARDAKLVADDASSDAATRSQARLVEGLALRGLGKPAEALNALQAALQADKSPPRIGDSRFQAQQAMRAMLDPLVYYVPEARRAVAGGRFDQALARIQEGLEVFPKNTPGHGILLAERSAARLAQVQSQGKADAADSRVVEAGNDAKAAIAAKADAEGSYALGRWHEALGQVAEAQKAYERAVEAHPGLDVAGGRYRVALAQLLARQYGPRITQQAPPRTQASTPGVWNPLAAVAGLLVLIQDEEQDIKTPPELDRAVQLANEAIQCGNPDGHFVKALALAAKHRWTDAVLEYGRGLEKLSGGSPERAQILRYLIENHPALKIPDGQRPPDVQAAERHFDQGLQFYWERRYPQAEKEFAQAIRSYDQDARFLYFLGLAQLSQEHRDQAQESFRKAGTLELQGKPQGAIVSSSLERVQGPQRNILNHYRP